MPEYLIKAGEKQYRIKSDRPLNPEQQKALARKALGLGTPQGAPVEEPPALAPEPSPETETAMDPVADAQRRMAEMQAMTTPNAENPPFNKRTLLEGGLGTLGSLLVPGSGMLAALGRAGAAGVGGAAGSLASETFDPTANPLRTAALSGGLQAGGDLAGSAMTGTLSKLFPARTVTQGARDADAFLGSQGARLTPGQMTESRAVDIAENIAEGSLLGGGAVKNVKDKAVEKAGELIDQHRAAFGPGGPKEDVARLTQQAIEGRRAQFRTLMDKAYSNIDAAAQGVTVDIRPAKQFAQQALEDAEWAVNDPGTARILRRIAGMPDTGTFQQAQRLRSSLLGVTRSGNDVIAGQKVGMAKELASLIDQQMEAGATALDPRLTGAWRQANEAWKAGKEVFNDDFVKNLVHSEPQFVVDKILKANQPGTIRNMRQLIQDPDVWSRIQGTYLDDAIGKSFDDNGNLIGGKLAREFKRFGDPALAELFNPAQVERFHKLARTLQLAQSKAGAGDFSMAVKFGQFGALMGGAGALLYTGDPMAAGAAAAPMLLGPAVLAKAMMHPAISRLIIEGVQTPAGTAAGRRLVGRLAGLLAKEGLTEEPENGSATQE